MLMGKLGVGLHLQFIIRVFNRGDKVNPILHFPFAKRNSSQDMLKNKGNLEIFTGEMLVEKGGRGLGGGEGRYLPVDAIYVVHEESADLTDPFLPSAFLLLDLKRRS